jgi:glucosylceramidase
MHDGRINAPENDSPHTARWVVTTRDATWQQRQPVPVTPMRRMPSVFLELDKPQQEVEGFGACFNEMGWLALELLPDSSKEAVLQELFAPGFGADLSLCRMPIGANDFSRDWYSYDEEPDDYDLTHFSIQNDHDTLVPFIRAAQRHRPDLRLWASPWSPPTWMKTNGHYAGAQPVRAAGQPENGLRDDQVGIEGTDMIRLDDDVLAAYAGYFGRFIDAYSELGIRVDIVMPQNEFNTPQIFPSCTWTPDGLIRFLRHLAPQMQRRGVEVFLGTLERSNPDLALRVLAEPDLTSEISGVGVQWFGKGAAPVIHHAYPELRMYQTEQECGDGANDWRFARYAWSLMRDAFRNGATAYMYWNMALIQGGVSRWGWTQNSLFTVDTESRIAVANHELSVLKHASHFVKPGAHVIPAVSYSGYENQVAFQNPDGEVIVIIQNDLPNDSSLAISIDHDRMVEVVLPGDSLSTFAIGPSAEQ